MTNKEKLNYMEKRIEDDLFWLIPLAIHLLETNDITGAHRLVSALNDLKLFKSYINDFRGERKDLIEEIEENEY